MRRLIDAEILLYRLRKIQKDAYDYGPKAAEYVGKCIAAVTDSDTVDYTEPSHAYWIYEEVHGYGGKWICSRCNKPYRATVSIESEPAWFCPYCGSIMDDDFDIKN